jgi:hypothetical protein
MRPTQNTAARSSRRNYTQKPANNNKQRGKTATKHTNEKLHIVLNHPQACGFLHPAAVDGTVPFSIRVSSHIFFSSHDIQMQNHPATKIASTRNVTTSNSHVTHSQVVIEN